MESKYILILLTSILILVGLSTQKYLGASVPIFDPKVAIDVDYYSKVSFCDLNEIELWTCIPCQKHKNV